MVFKAYDWFDFYQDANEAIPHNMPEARGNDIIITCFVDTNHAGDQKTRKSQTGVLIFMNKVPIHWYSKQQASVESSTFGTEFCALKTALEMIEGMRCKIRMFGVPIDGPANVYCDNEVAYKKQLCLNRSCARNTIPLLIIGVVRQWQLKQSELPNKEQLRT